MSLRPLFLTVNHRVSGLSLFALDRSARWREHLSGVSFRSVLVFLASYYVSVRLSEHAYGTLAVSSPFWLPGAVLLSSFLLTQKKHWWLIALAVFPIRLAAGAPAGTPLWFLLFSSADELLVTLFAAWLLLRVLGRSVRLDKLKEFMIFLGIAAGIAPALSAIIAAPGRHALGDEALGAAFRWFLGNALAQAIATPTLLYWYLAVRERIYPPLKELLVLSSALTGVLAYAFLSSVGPYSPILSYAPVPFIVWAALRLRPIGTATAVSILAFTSMLSAAGGVGLFSKGSSSQNVLSLQLFLLVVSIPLLSLSIIIDERKRTEGIPRQNEEQFRLAMNNVASGVYTLDMQGITTYVNPAAEAMFGWTQEELLGKKMHDMTHHKHPDGSPFPASDCPGLQVLQKDVELREHEDMFIRKDGSFFPVVFTASPLKKDSETIGLVVGFRDDTLRQEGEKAVRESEERFRLVANTAPVKIWMSGVDGRCTYFNERWLRFTGRPLEAELGNGWQEAVHAEDLGKCLDTYSKAFDRRASYQMEYRLRRHDEEYRWILSSAVPRFDANGSFAGYIGSALDVTERKLAEDALSTVSQKLIQAHEEERTRIARELHDDINQRLALLVINLDSLKQVLPPSRVDLRLALDEEIRQAAELGSDVQNLSHRLHSSRLEHLGFVRAADSFCRELADLRKVKIDFHSENVPRELSDGISLSLFRVLQEALQNAIKHSGSKRFQVFLRGGVTEIELTVRDTGQGFDAEEAMKGHGIGLTSMKERLKLVNGNLSIDSQPQRGTTIHGVPLQIGMKSAAVGQ